MAKVVKGKTDLWTTAPHIANLLLYPENGYSLSLESHKKDYFICPNCGEKIYRWVRTVTRHGLKCPICSDGVSYPEKFVANLLKQLHINYMHDNSYEWSNNKRYDFYIENLSLIIETHGIQHYSDETTFHNRNDSLEKEKENDAYKKELALQVGIQNYIELDCRYSEFEYIKNSILNSELNTLLSLSLIDWDKLSKDCLKSKVMEVCEVYNSGVKSVNKLSMLLGLNKSTVTDYLKHCNEIGLCDYIPNPLHERAVICVDTGKVYESLKYVELDGFNKSQVSECCNHKEGVYTAGGYNWCFLDEYDPDTYIMKVPKFNTTPKKVLWIETGKTYEKLTHVKEDGFSPSRVSEVCNGNASTHRKQHFKFV
jgi:predicted RNA-binding Zn-ribbon protein involved in translation (DUF1610 family)